MKSGRGPPAAEWGSGSQPNHQIAEFPLSEAEGLGDLAGNGGERGSVIPLLVTEQGHGLVPEPL